MPLEGLLADFHFGGITAFHQMLFEYCRISLKSSNEILLILTSYEPIKNFLKALRDIDSNMDSRQKDGSLVIRESAKAYFNLADELVDIIASKKPGWRYSGASKPILFSQLYLH